MAKQGPILIAEDDQDDREILAEVFASLDIKYELIFFSNGKELLDFLYTGSVQPFLIITDVNLPRISGTEVARKIFEDPVLRNKSIPFVLLTTSADPVAVKEAYTHMVQGYFQKEHSFEQVKNMIRLITEYWRICKHPNNM